MLEFGFSPSPNISVSLVAVQPVAEASIVATVFAISYSSLVARLPAPASL